MSQGGATGTAATSAILHCKAMWFTAERFYFFSRKSHLRLAFLRKFEVLGFLVLVPFFISLLLVSKEKEKAGPMAREKLKAWPWLASAWQKSMHLETRVELTSSTAAILVYF